MNNNKYKILLVEDEANILTFVGELLESNEYQVIKAESCTEAETLYASYLPDLVILDLGLPDRDGTEFLRGLRQRGELAPVLVLSARSDEAEKVRALDMGADDYVVKPFGVSELLARIRTTLRRSDRIRGGHGERKERYEVKDLVVDIARHQILKDGEEIHFTQNEFKILELLAVHAGKVLTYDFILEHVWGPFSGNNGNQILRVNMANIRRKLKENPSEPNYIHTELGIGYRMLED